MTENPSSCTSKPSGTVTVIPPITATALMTTSSPSISAWRRSIWHPPMTATAVVRAAILQRPLADVPLSTATNRRRAVGRTDPTVGSASGGRSARAASSSPRTRAPSTRPTRWENSSNVSRPSTRCSRKRDTARSRSASATRIVIWSREGTGARLPGSDASATAPVCSLRPVTAGGPTGGGVGCLSRPWARPWACPRHDASRGAGAGISGNPPPGGGGGRSGATVAGTTRRPVRPGAAPRAKRPGRPPRGRDPPAPAPARPAGPSRGAPPAAPRWRLPPSRPGRC